MGWYGITLGVLGVWRITHLLSSESGPAQVLVRFRHLFGNGPFGQLLDCFYCLSLWTAIPFAVAIASGKKERVLTWLALSGGTILLERASVSRATIPPAFYQEDEQVTHVLH